MNKPSNGLIQEITNDMTLGAAKYENFRAYMLKETNTLMLVWEDLSYTVQMQWEQVGKNISDPLMTPSARMWDAHTATVNNPLMPLWVDVPVHVRAAWDWAFSEKGEDNMPTIKPSEAMEQLRKMRAYSKCFTKAFDRGQAVFVLVEQDKSAYKAIAQWINLNIERLGAGNPKIIAAKATMARFMEFENQKEPD